MCTEVLFSAPLDSLFPAKNYRANGRHKPRGSANAMGATRAGNKKPLESEANTEKAASGSRPNLLQRTHRRRKNGEGEKGNV